jgi:hypothetical protein
VAALTHFRSLHDLWLPTASDSKDVMLVHSHYGTSKGFISASQLRSDLASENWTVPEDARLDMKRRTDGKEPFHTAGFPSFIRVIDFDFQPPGDVTQFPLHHPDAKCSITLWPPGYTRDGRRAVVRFLFGPTPHGASAIYLLELRDGLWHVVRHSVSYYV